MSLHTQSTTGRKVEALLRDELQAAQEVLALQQRDNYRFQDYVKILESEVDSLRELSEDKQKIINFQSIEIKKRDDRIRELEELVHHNKVDKHAFKAFEHQNLLLLDELKETKLKMDELEVEVRFLRDYKDDRLDYNEDKMKMVAEMEIKLNGHQYEYKFE